MFKSCGTISFISNNFCIIIIILINSITMLISSINFYFKSSKSCFITYFEWNERWNKFNKSIDIIIVCCCSFVNWYNKCNFTNRTDFLILKIIWSHPINPTSPCMLAYVHRQAWKKNICVQHVCLLPAKTLIQCTAYRVPMLLSSCLHTKQNSVKQYQPYLRLQVQFLKISRVCRMVESVYVAAKWL